METRTIGRGRFTLLANLGRGGQAVVLRVHDGRLGIDRALKVLLPECAANRKVRARFVEEARAMAVLEHPNVVRVYDVSTDGSLPFIVMELLPGGSLADWVDRNGPFPPRQAARVATQICAGIAAAHARGIVHRDLKPENVLVAQDGTARVTDFGIARTLDNAVTRVGAQLGTLGYMAPEQAEDATLATPRSDVYAIGVTLYVLLTGRDPHDWFVEAGTERIPGPLLDVIREATARRPELRHATVNHLAAALNTAIAALPPDALEIPLGPVPLPAGPVDPSDIETLLDSADPAPPKGTPLAALGYRMPNQAPRRHVSRDPSWSETPAPATPHGFVVELDEEERARSREARERRTATPGPRTAPQSEESPADLGVSELGTFAKEVLTAMVRAVVQLRALPILVAIGLVVAGYTVKARWDAERAQHQLLERRDALEALITSDADLLDAMAAQGADGNALRALYAKWQFSVGPDRPPAALLLIDEVVREADRLGVSGPDLERWRDAAAEYRRAVRLAG